jgi:hypothetical protein
MKAVSRFEFNLLRILHFFLGRVPLEQARPLVSNPVEKGRPKCLSKAAVELVQDALGKGTVELLARAGGWRPESFLRTGKAKEGRLWQRTPPRELGLPFSRHALDFLIWITAVKPSDQRTNWVPPENELTMGDLLLLYYAYAGLRDTDVGPALRARATFTRHGLCRLAYPDDFAQNTDNPDPDFAPWTTGLGACILEALQRPLTDRWLEIERGKCQILEWQQLRALGRAQEQVLTRFLDAVEAAERPDLARFLMRAAGEILTEDVTPRFWVGGLQTTGPRMADRQETNQAALALVRQFERFRRWERQARSVGFFDEGYGRCKLFLADWEGRRDRDRPADRERREGDVIYGDIIYRRAQAIVEALDPMRT